MKKIIYIASITFVYLIAFNKNTFGQERRQIHFLADTINVSPENRILEIGTEGDGDAYTFYCKCLPPYSYNLSFGYSKKGLPANQVVSAKPNYKYISWKELSKIVSEAKYDFSKQYDFFVTEVLTNGYKTNKVRMVKYSAPIVDISTLKSKDN